MTVSFYIDPDWAVIDDPRTVTFRRKLTHTTFADGVSVAYALRRDVSKQDMESRGLMVEVGVDWHLWSQKLPAGVVPKVGDVIEDASSVRWTVILVSVASLGTRYRCTTIQER